MPAPKKDPKKMSPPNAGRSKPLKVYPPIKLKDAIIVQKTDEAYLKDLIKFWTDGGMTNLSISLKCPVTKTRMKMPCRGIDCTHVQCFDGDTFLKMNEKQFGKWLCNICGKPSPLNKLFVDGYLLEILKTVSDDVEDIYFDKNGDWSDHDPSVKDSPLDYSVIDLSETLDVIDLTGTDDESIIESPPKRQTPSKVAIKTGNKTKSVSEQVTSKENQVSDPKTHSYPLRTYVNNGPRTRQGNGPYSRPPNAKTARQVKEIPIDTSKYLRRPLHQTWHHNQILFREGFESDVGFCFTGNFQGLDFSHLNNQFPSFKFKAFVLGNCN